MRKLSMPDDRQDLTVVASVSGGKDSTALILALREAEIPARYVFADTGWEADETYVYLDFLRDYLRIEIEQVGVEGGMEARCRHRAGFPGRMQRFCTRELKIEPLRAFHDQVEEETGKETISAMGVRAAESERRSTMPEWEDEGPRYTRDRWGGWVWRPLIAWSVQDVLEIHRRHAVPVNPLYQLGHDRVGCYPCIYSNKEEVKLISIRTPDRIDKIRALEAEMTALRQVRNEVTPGRYKHVDDATFFQTQRQGFSGIDKVVEWARTDYGGKQFNLFAEPPKGGCMKWGACDFAAHDAETEQVARIALDALDEGRRAEAMTIAREVLQRMLDADRMRRGV